MTIIGIDLGTTNSACSVWREGRVQMIPNRLGDVLTPSVVHISDAEIVSVGKTANEKRILEPDRTASLVKRYMGTDRKISVGDRHYTPSELSAFILRSLKEDAEVYLEQAVSEIVLSVPAYFNDVQRKASVSSANMAGLEVRRLINEPTAAAIAYGLHEKPENTHFMVLDLGGGTFDVSIMEYFDGVLEVHSSAGDNFLGGEDFLEALVLKYLDKINSSKDDLGKNDLSRVYKTMEMVKRELNSNEKLTIQPFLSNQPATVEMDYNEFEEVTESLMQRVRLPIETALRDSNLEPNDLNEILLVGGSTRMKLFRKAVTKMFRRMPSANLNPDEVVAMGAGIQAGLLLRDAALEDIVLTDVSPYSLGTGILNENDNTGTVGDIFDPIIERNTTVPVSLEKTYSSVVDNQASLMFAVFQGESRLVKNNISIGTLEVRIPKNKAGLETVTIRFSYDVSGLLEVDTHVVSTGEKHNIVIQNSSGILSDKQIEISKEKLSKMKFHPRDEEINRELVARAERLYEGRLREQRSIIRDYLSQFESILESQVEEEIKTARREFETILKQFEHELL